MKQSLEVPGGKNKPQSFAQKPYLVVPLAPGPWLHLPFYWMMPSRESWGTWFRVCESPQGDSLFSHYSPGCLSLPPYRICFWTIFSQKPPTEGETSSIFTLDAQWGFHTTEHLPRWVRWRRKNPNRRLPQTGQRGPWWTASPEDSIWLTSTGPHPLVSWSRHVHHETEKQGCIFRLHLEHLPSSL